MTDVVELEYEFRFEAAHRLPNVPAGHKCHRLHGHSFRATVTVQGPVDPHLGWYIDYAEIRNAVEPIRLQLDHNFLNEVEGLSNPTSEVLARGIWDRLLPSFSGMVAIRVAETCTSSCVYRGERSQ